MYYDDPPQSAGCGRSAVFAALAVVAIAAVFYFGTPFIARKAADKLNPFGSNGIANPLAAQPTVINVDRPAIIQSIRSVNKLEATTFIADKFIQAGQQGSTLYNLFLGDKILLIANGQVVAGFDLSKLRDQDIDIPNRETITLMLPSPEVLSSKLNNDKTTVYQRETGIASKGNPGLEAEARRIAEVEIVRGTCESGILDRANADGQRNMESLLKGLGFKQVTVKTQPGTCTLAGGAPLPPSQAQAATTP